MVKCFKNFFVVAVAFTAILFVNGCASSAPEVEEVALVDAFAADMAAYVEFPAVGAEASGYQESKGLVPALAIDGDLETHWTAEGKHWIVLDLGAVKKVAAVEVATKKGSERKYEMMFEASADGATYSTILDKTKSSGRSEDFEMYDTINIEAQFIKINVYGASSSAWNNVREIKVYGVE